MIATTLEYIESDFAHGSETCAEYRRRTAAPGPHGAIRRACRRFLPVR